jgi:hypothetical protein
MKTALTSIFFFCASIICVLPQTSWASGGGAVYIVPTTPELASHSRFDVKIIAPFRDENTTMIKYQFPEILTGDPNFVVELTKVSGGYDQSVWENELMRAHCFVNAEIFNCNIYLKKDQASDGGYGSFIFDLLIPSAKAQVALQRTLCSGQALRHLDQMDLSRDDHIRFTNVIGSFCSNEPAGILSYEL